MELHPPAREAAFRLSKMNEGDFVSDAALEKLLRAKRESDDFRFAFIDMGRTLRGEYGMGIVRATHNGERGYRIADDLDKINILAQREKKRAMTALVNQRQHLANVRSPEALNEDMRNRYDHQLRGNAIVLAAMETSYGPRKIPSVPTQQQLEEGDPEE